MTIRVKISFTILILILIFGIAILVKDLDKIRIIDANVSTLSNDIASTNFGSVFFSVQDGVENIEGNIFATIDQNGKNLSLEMDEFSFVGDTKTFNYTLENRSLKMDARISASIFVNYPEYLSVSIDESNFIIPANNSKEMCVTVQLIKAPPSNITCSYQIKINATEYINDDEYYFSKPFN